MSRRAILDRLRAANSDEAGMTLTELMVSVALMAVVATIFTTMLTSIQTSVLRQQARSDTTDAARLAIQRIDAEVRSGRALHVPTGAATCGGKDCGFGYGVRVWTLSRTAAGQDPRCVQWVIDGQTLFRRTWVPGAASTLGGWQVVATGVVNRNLSASTTPAGPVVPFTLTGTNVLNVNLMMNSQLGGPRAPRTVPVATSVAVRNAASPDECASEPGA